MNGEQTQKEAPTTERRVMDPELKAKWLEALRSGRYQQGRECLRDADNRYCCLGVLADLVEPEKWSTLPTESTKVARDLYVHDGHEEMIGFTLQKHLHIDEFVTNLAAMNDGEDGDPQSFEAIAEWIERNL